jgi:hypothetical protein
MRRNRRCYRVKQQFKECNNMNVGFSKARLSLFIVKVKTNMYGTHANFKPS